MIGLDYKFDGEWYTFSITEEKFTDALIEFIKQEYSVDIDGRYGDVYYMFTNMFNIDMDDIVDEGEFGDFIHKKFETRAREDFDEYKEEELLASEPW